MEKDNVKYFEIKNLKKRRLIIGNNELLVKLDVQSGNLEVLNHPPSFLEGIALEKDPQGKYSVNSSAEDAQYEIVELSYSQVQASLKAINLEWSCWQNYFSRGDVSVHLTGPGGERLA